MEGLRLDNIKRIKSSGKDIYSVNFADYLPEPLKQDSKMKALAAAVTNQMLDVSAEIDNVLIYSRINELPEELVDILAFDMHVDWYDYSYSLEAKRDILKDSVKVHKKLGTKYAIEKALGAIYPNTKIEEWFSYGGKPFYFRIRLDGNYNSAISIADILQKMLIYKRASAHLETICIVYCIKIVMDYKNAVRARIKFWPRQNLEYLSLNGKRNLNGSQKLDGCDINANINLYPVHTIAKIPVLMTTDLKPGGNIIKILTIVNKSYRQTLKARIRFWPRQNLEFLYLDGRRKLNGSRNLNGYNTNANINLYPVCSIARIQVPIRSDLKPCKNITKMLVPINKSYIQSIEAKMRFYLQQHLKSIYTVCFPVKVYTLEQKVLNVNVIANTTISVNNSCINSTRLSLQTTNKDMQYKSGSTLKNEVNTIVCTKKAHIKIHGYLNGTRKLNGSRKLNAGTYEL